MAPRRVPRHALLLALLALAVLLLGAPLQARADDDDDDDDEPIALWKPMQNETWDTDQRDMTEGESPRFTKGGECRKCLCSNPPELEALIADYLSSVSSDGKDSDALPFFHLSIPLAFHVIHAADSTGLVPLFAIQDQVRVINEAFQNREVATLGAWPTGIQFTLNESDVHYINNTDWHFGCNRNDMQHTMKTQLASDPSRFVNIYLCQLSFGFLGISGAWPWEAAANDPRIGVMVGSFTLPGTNNYPFNMGRTAVHELGHLFGLRHPFGKQDGKCPLSVDSEQDDTLFDTTPTDTPTFGGWEGPDKPPSCDALAAVKSPCVGNNTIDAYDETFHTHLPPYHGRVTASNFLDYADDPCQREFSPMQVLTMRRMILRYKPEWCTNLGVNGSCFVPAENWTALNGGLRDRMLDVANGIQRIQRGGDAGIDPMAELVSGNITRDVLDVAVAIMDTTTELQFQIAKACKGKVKGWTRMGVDEARGTGVDEATADACARMGVARDEWFSSYQNKDTISSASRRMDAFEDNASETVLANAMLGRNEAWPTQEELAQKYFAQFL